MKFVRNAVIFAVAVGILVVIVWTVLWRKGGGIASTPPAAPAAETVVLLGVQPLEIVPVEYSRDLDFGKGKFALFDFSVPSDSDFRLEQLVVSVDGATDTEMPQAWLRFNSVRVYTTAEFHNGEAAFTAFPPVVAAATSIDDVPIEKDIPHERLENVQESQIVLKPLQPLSRLLPRGSTVSVGMYGKWADGIAPRPVENGMRFCLKEISGTLVGSGKSAKTRFAQPPCWSRMGIRP